MLWRIAEPRIVCADASGERLGRIRQRLSAFASQVIYTRSAADCLSATAESRPDIIVLDSDLLFVDSENIPEYISRISARSRVLLTVHDPSQWMGKPLQHVDAIVRRDDLDTLLEMIRHLG